MGNSGPTSGQSETTRLVNWHLKLVGGGEDCGTEFLNYGGEKVRVLLAQSSPTLSDPMDCSPSGSSVHGILQATILKWVGSHSLLQAICPTQRLNPVSLFAVCEICYLF